VSTAGPGPVGGPSVVRYLSHSVQEVVSTDTAQRDAIAAEPRRRRRSPKQSGRDVFILQYPALRFEGIRLAGPSVGRCDPDRRRSIERVTVRGSAIDARQPVLWWLS